MTSATKDKSWGAVVSEIMRENGITQRRLAEVAEINRSTLRKLMAGHDECVRIVDMVKVMSVLGYVFDAVRVEDPSAALKRAKPEDPTQTQGTVAPPVVKPGKPKRLIPYYNGSAFDAD